MIPIVALTGVKTEGKDVDTILKEAGLDWEPMFTRVLGEGLSDPLPGKFLMYRSDNKKPLAVVGRQYRATLPREFVQSQLALAEALGGQLVAIDTFPYVVKKDHVLPFRVVAFIRLQEQVQIQHMDKGDPIGLFITTVDGWDGATARQSRLYVERVVCRNGLTSRMLEAEIWTSHTSGIDSRWQIGVAQFMEKVRKKKEEVVTHLQKMAQTPMEPKEAMEFFQQLIPGDHPRIQRKREFLMTLFHRGEGNLGQTRYDALNAVTEFVTHHRRYRDVATQTFSIIGDEPLRERAWRLLYEWN